MFKLVKETCLGAVGISMSAVLGGLVTLCAWHGLDWSWRELQPFLLAASVPWLMLFVGLLWLTWRRLWAGFESLAGYDLDGIGPEEIRIVPYRGPGKLIDGVIPEDLRHFVETITQTQDWTQRAWRGVKMPSGRRCDNDYWAAMTGILRKTGVIVDAGPRATGRLTTKSAEEVMHLLGL